MYAPAAAAGSLTLRLINGERVDNRQPHFVRRGAFDPTAPEKLTAAKRDIYFASQWRLMWWKFRRHRLAVISGAVLLVLYASALVSEMLAPYNHYARHTEFVRSPQFRDVRRWRGRDCVHEGGVATGQSANDAN